LRQLLVACLAAAVAACDSPTTTPQPNANADSPPSDWVTVSNLEGSIQLALPPYIQAFDNHGAIFANEPPRAPGADIPIQVWAQGPITDDAPRPGEDLLAWVERRLENPGKGTPTVTNVSLPAGAGIRYDRVDSAGTPNAWRIVVFAIESPRGVAWLMLDGPPDEWAARAEDLERVALLFRVR
jgi:hypothetical protein